MWRLICTLRICRLNLKILKGLKFNLWMTFRSFRLKRDITYIRIMSWTSMWKTKFWRGSMMKAKSIFWSKIQIYPLETSLSKRNSILYLKSMKIRLCPLSIYYSSPTTISHLSNCQIVSLNSEEASQKWTKIWILNSPSICLYSVHIHLALTLAEFPAIILRLKSEELA